MHVSGEGCLGMAPLGGGRCNITVVVPMAAAGRVSTNRWGFYRERLRRYAVWGKVSDGKLSERLQITGPFEVSPRRVVGPGGTLRLRRDSRWIVPEPELTLVVSPSGTITAYTIGNDLSCRDIEGENPLYLPQAKTFDACAALGPALWIPDVPLPAETEIRLEILRNSAPVFSAVTDLRQMKRRPDELVAYLFAETTFPDGCLLMTGTGIVPPDDFTLVSGDEVRITIEPIGTLANVVRSP
ncbi:MAG: fumarylacetoacetate hydrolase family protein [Planctomycetes bacterium]|nr:fumarylacetoacetate hydrolase family protein [Planctomycetota bacterium]